MRSLRPRRTTTATGLVAVALSLGLLAGCGGDSETSDDPTSPSPAGSPFGVEFEGPSDAEAGEEITVTLTNTGRLPDAFQLSVEPTGAASFEEQDFTLSPEESTDVQVTVEDVPLVLIVKSVGGGGGERVADLEIG